MGLDTETQICIVKVGGLKEKVQYIGFNKTYLKVNQAMVNFH